MSSTNRGAKRKERDAYPTPSWCTELIVQEIVWGPIPSVWEPAAGDGAITEVVETYLDRRIVSSDIEPSHPNFVRHDFLTEHAGTRFDIIITNPPFSLAREFIERALTLANCVIMLLPLGFYGSEERHEWWTQHEPTAQFILSKRPMFAKNKDGKWGTDSETYAWLVWDSAGRQKRGIFHLCPTEEQYKRSVAEHRARYDARERELMLNDSSSIQHATRQQIRCKESAAKRSDV